MCFTPIVSLSIAIIEFVLATVLLLFFRKTSLRNFFAVLIYVLGFYQFTEFMLCTTNYADLWAKMGFIAYTFLPAIGLHAMLKIFKRKFKLFWIYIIPVLASLTAVISPNFILDAKCATFFIEVSFIFGKKFGSLGNTLYWIYILYYFGFILASLLTVIKDFFHQKNKIKKLIDEDIAIGVILMTVPTFILVVLLRFFEKSFPSVLCGFAVFVAISAFIAVYLESKTKSKKL